MKNLLLILLSLMVVVVSQASVPAPSELPKPAGLKTIIETPQTAIYQAQGSVEMVRSDVAGRFAADGWQPYGEAGDTRYFKKGKVRALTSVSAGPPPAGKVMLTLMSEPMSADLPAPSNVIELQYSDTTKSLGFTTPDSPQQVDVAYRKMLEPDGWSTNMPEPVKNELDFVIIYRHPGKGMIRVEMRPTGDKLRVLAKYQTKEEVDAETAKAAAQGEALKAKLAAEANAPLPEFFVSAPKGTTKHFATKGGYAIVLKPGTAMRAAQGISTELQAQGWKDERPLPLAPQTGMINLTRDNLQMSIVFMDPGPVPAEVTITSPKVSIKVKP